MGLAFSYNDIPQDGFVAGVDGQGGPYVIDLHLGHAGREKKDIYIFFNLVLAP